MAQSAQLVNCKKCGALFVKSSNRDICDACHKREVSYTDSIKNYIHTSGKAKVTLDEIIQGTGLKKEEVELLFEKGKLFGVMNKISIKCRFCGIEFECEQKPSFVCPNCINKFTKKDKEVQTNAYSIIGKRGIVIKDIDPISGKGQVKIGTEVWSAKSIDDRKIEKGLEVEIIEIEGVKAVVK